LFIFTEWVPGGSLSDILKKFGKLDVYLTARYTKQMLVGLNYLHTHDVIHLDIKPGNVLIDNLGCVKLADFGASRKLVDGQSVKVGGSNSGGGGKENETVEMLGTPYFMAPEIIRQERHGRQADIWSVACTVLNMFTGVPPWSNSSVKSSNVMALLLQIERAKGPPPYPLVLESEPFGTETDDANARQMHSHLRTFLDDCYQRNFNDRPSAIELLNYSFINGTFSKHVIKCFTCFKSNICTSCNYRLEIF